MLASNRAPASGSKRSRAGPPFSKPSFVSRGTIRIRKAVYGIPLPSLTFPVMSCAAARRPPRAPAKASLVVVVDPWWNPAVEEQAINRCHRLGQGRRVEVLRLIVPDSVEEKMLALQVRCRPARAGPPSPLARPGLGWPVLCPALALQRKKRELAGNVLQACRLHSDGVQTTCRLHSDYIRTTFGLHSDYMQSADYMQTTGRLRVRHSFVWRNRRPARRPTSCSGSRSSTSTTSRASSAEVSL